jgi:hypothetical protein
LATGSGFFSSQPAKRCRTGASRCLGGTSVGAASPAWVRAGETPAFPGSPARWSESGVPSDSEARASPPASFFAVAAAIFRRMAHVAGAADSHLCLLPSPSFSSPDKRRPRPGARPRGYPALAEPDPGYPSVDSDSQPPLGSRLRMLPRSTKPAAAGSVEGPEKDPLVHLRESLPSSSRQRRLSGMKVEDLQSAVSELTAAQLATFAKWFEEFFADQWDRQIEADILVGRLDAAAKRADEDFESGRCTPLP